MLLHITIYSTFAALTAAFPANGKVEERGCGKLALNGGGPIPGDGSIALYLNAGGPLRVAARSAPIPANYTVSFVDNIGSTEGEGYITHHVLRTATYDVDQCAKLCDAKDDCVAFNIYFARDPMYEEGAGCVDPPPVTNIDCALYSQAVSPKSATNTEQEREEFTRVNVGSNGYNKHRPLANFKKISTLNDTAIVAPESYLTYKFFENVPYDPEMCAVGCMFLAHRGDNCVFFNAYTRTEDGEPVGTVCAYYNALVGAHKALEKGRVEGWSVHGIADSTVWALYDWELYGSA